MSVNVTWSSSNGGSALDEPVDHGSGSSGSGSALTEQIIFLSHDADNPITGCRFYLAEKSGDYSGDATPSEDLSEILGWGDEETSSEYGGVQLNMDAENSFPSESWPVFDNKERNSSQTFRTGVGDSEDNGIVLPTEMGLSSPGEIPAGDSPDVSFAVRIYIPTASATLGTREFDQKLRFSFTS